jgi:hypothetical protein
MWRKATWKIFMYYWVYFPSTYLHIILCSFNFFFFCFSSFSTVFHAFINMFFVWKSTLHKQKNVKKRYCTCTDTVWYYIQQRKTKQINRLSIDSRLNVDVVDMANSWLYFFLFCLLLVVFFFFFCIWWCDRLSYIRVKHNLFYTPFTKYKKKKNAKQYKNHP